MLLELFEGIDNPQMITMNIGLSLSSKRDTRITLFNYIEYMKYSDYSYSDLYNWIVETALRRKIQLNLLNCFVFIQEIPNLKDFKFINSILFTWNMNSNQESMISIWSEFWDAKRFDYYEVILLWDGMKLDDFMKIFLAVSNTKIKLKIHANKDKDDYWQFLEEISLNQLNSTSIKLWDKDEYILWSSLRHKSEINLRQWYYHASSQQNKAIKISNWCIKYSNSFVHIWTTKQSINLDKIKSIYFDLLPVTLTDHEISNWSDRILFEKNKIYLDIGLDKNANYKQLEDGQIYFLNQSVKVTNNFNPQLKYFKKDYLINLEITNMALEKNDVASLINKMTNFGNIKTLSLLINEPSSAIDILYWCKQANSIKSITLEVIKSFTLIENYNLRLYTNQLKFQGKRVYVYEPNKVLKRFLL